MDDSESLPDSFPRGTYLHFQYFFLKKAFYSVTYLRLLTYIRYYLGSVPCMWNLKFTFLQFFLHYFSYMNTSTSIKNEAVED